MIMQILRRLFASDDSGEARQIAQAAQSRDRVADTTSCLLRDACAENIRETDHLAQWVREIRQQEMRG